MKNIFYSLLAGMFFLFALAEDTEAKRRSFGFVPVKSGTYVTKVAELPKHLIPSGKEDYDLGWKHTRFSVLGMPFWGTTEGKYVLYRISGRGWYSIPLNLEQIASMETILNMYWGWLVLLPILAIALLRKLSGQRRVPANTKSYSGKERRLSNDDERFDPTKDRRIDDAIASMVRERENKSANIAAGASGRHRERASFGRR